MIKFIKQQILVFNLKIERNSYVDYHFNLTKTQIRASQIEDGFGPQLKKDLKDQIKNVQKIINGIDRKIDRIRAASL